ncbi:ORF11 [macacine gammaherpesvirus 12]|uniref:ORF11 n=1 Tax=macacine gammaherpesvirus 12 TaxID=2560571 RepID=A0A0B5CYR0_9GAMA|nr:ORF11 [Macaca nemestrina rhadinovirus 2]AJE29650.1 ORF11 [Macaca nemestrina rhadinovirus 2]
MGTPVRFFRGEWQTSSLVDNGTPRYSSLVWAATIHDGYLTLVNRSELRVTERSPCLPACPSVGRLVGKKFPGFAFASATLGDRGTRTVFYAFGHRDNPLDVVPTVVERADRELVLRVHAPRTTRVSRYGLKIFVAIVTVVRPPGVFLHLPRDRAPIALTDSCSQEGFLLTSEEPRIKIQGLPLLSDETTHPFLLTQKTKPFTERGFCRLIMDDNQRSVVNTVYLGKNHVRVTVNRPPETLVSGGQVTATLSLTGKAPVAFRHNPYFELPWSPASAIFTPVVYVGLTVCIPPNSSKFVSYENTYVSSFDRKLTAIISNHAHSGGFRIQDCEWPPDRKIEILVTNVTQAPVYISTGTQLGRAIFLFAPRLSGTARMRRLLGRRPSALELPGGVTVDSQKLCQFETMYLFSSL